MANETKNLIQGVTGGITIDTEPTSGSEYPVMSKGVYSAINSAKPSNATASKAGLVKKAANVAAITAEEPAVSDCVTAINSLLSALKTAGIMVADS